MAYTVDIRDEVTGALRALPVGLSAGAINPAIGAGVVRLFQNHLLQQPENKHGWPSTHFWSRAAKATSYNLLAEGVVVSVNQQGIRQRYFGGEITPVNSKFLTIPARAEAYGKRAGEFSNLKVAFGRNGPFALVETAYQEVSFGKKRKDGSQSVTKGAEHGGAVMFWLVKSVNQSGDKDIIPSDEAIGEAATAVVEAAVLRALRRAGKG